MQPRGKSGHFIDHSNAAALQVQQGNPPAGNATVLGNSAVADSWNQESGLLSIPEGVQVNAVTGKGNTDPPAALTWAGGFFTGSAAFDVDGTPTTLTTASGSGKDMVGGAPSKLCWPQAF